MSNLSAEAKRRQDDARNSGKFGVQEHTAPDPSVTLVEPETRAQDAYEAALQARAAADKAAFLAGEVAISELLRNAGVTSVTLMCDDEDWSVYKIADENGDDLDETSGTDELRDRVNSIAYAFKEFDELGEEGDSYKILATPPALTLAELQTRLNAIEERPQSAATEVFDVSLAAVSQIVKAKFPDAVALTLEDINEDNDGSPFFGVEQVLGSDGVVLWAASGDHGEDGVDDFEDFEDSLLDWTPMLDRDMSRVSKIGNGNWGVTL